MLLLRIRVRLIRFLSLGLLLGLPGVSDGSVRLLLLALCLRLFLRYGLGLLLGLLNLSLGRGALLIRLCLG